MADLPCTRCDGCGRIADSEDGEPWTDWSSLPPGADLAVRAGIVKPIPCEECGGTGKAAAQAIKRGPAAPTLPPLRDDELETALATLTESAAGKLASWIQGARLVLSMPNPPAGLALLVEQTERTLNNLCDWSRR